MIVVGTLIALGAGLVFALIASGVIVGIQYTMRTRMASRFRIMHNSTRTRVGSIVYVASVAALPTTLAILTAIELWHLVGRVWR